jgi:predicted P-loop ATPase
MACLPKTRINVGDLPDQPRPGSHQPLATIDNIAFLLDAASIRPRYNEIKKRVEVEIPGHKGTADNLDNATMATIVSLATQHGISHSLVPEFVNAIADRNAYNPVADWINSRGWDGIDRIPDIIATLEADPEYPQQLKLALIRKWLLSATAGALLSSGFKCRGVLTLQGAQGIGKTSWLKSLVDDQELRDSVVKLDHHIDAGNKDTILGAVSNWLVELGELESCFRKEVARLKSFITADFDRVRRPYARAESAYQRRTVFLATVNASDFLIDATGNTRFWTIPVHRINFTHGIDMQQVFAQLATELRGGGEWWLDSAEESVLAAWNQRHRATSATVDKVMDSLDLDRVDRPGNPAKTPTELLELLGFRLPISNQHAKECGALLREVLGPPKRINGRDRWRIPIRQDVLPPMKPVIASGADDEEY